MSHSLFRYYFLVWQWVFAFTCSQLFAENSIKQAKDVADAAAQFERLLEGLKQGTHLDIPARKKILSLLKKFQNRDVELDIQSIIEDLEDQSFNSAKEISIDLHQFLKELKGEIIETTNHSNVFPTNESLNSILEEQENIRHALENSLKKNIHTNGHLKKTLKKIDNLLKNKNPLEREISHIKKILRQASEGNLQPLSDYLGKDSSSELQALGEKKQAELTDKLEELQRQEESLASQLKKEKQNFSNAIERKIDQAANELNEHRTDKAKRILEEALQTEKKIAWKKVKREDRKIIENLAEKQKQLAQKYQSMIRENPSFDNRSKEEMEAQVSQMQKIANEVNRGSLDSGIWESKKLEDRITETIKKINFQLNQYHMDQRLVNLSNFLTFIEELQAKQLELHRRWLVKGPEEIIAKRTLPDQNHVIQFSKKRDQALKESESLAFVYGLNRIKKTLNDFLSILESRKLPTREKIGSLERQFEEIINGLKELKGKLARKKRPQKRESHSGQDVDVPEVTLLEELRYLRMLQIHLNEKREKNIGKNLTQEQREIMDMLLQLRARWSKMKKTHS